ncbi:inositol monophosphatase [Nocardia sp. 2]|uniref:Inositol-1-monophosphatase n=1 Tax=Nocardia acididurans TaxID=2802282 RepID=A0ABS1MBB0_9NOCA|nr:inositol monophosphatase family protein [Nocardia acididurans]MBL1077937.1 inositol monophosphatase [Nocardia acididurans]
MTPEETELLTIARRAVAIGGGLLESAEPGRVEKKGDRDLVTDLDLRIQRGIQNFLVEVTPTIEFLGEELTGSRPDPETSEAVWILDPIDGTSNFVHGLPLTAISLALVRDGTPAVGVVFAPLLGLEYYATAGQGAYSNGHRIRCSRAKSISESIVSLGDYAVGADAESKNRRRVAITSALASTAERVRMFGSAALDLVWVAEGRTDACVILSNKPWDTAAGVLIARESGALVTDSQGHRHTLASADTIASTPAIAEELLAHIDQSSRRR